MKLSAPPRNVVNAAAVLLATKIVTGFVTHWAVRARDFSSANINCLGS